MGLLQGRGVVGAVAGDRHHLSYALQRLHEPLFVHRSGAGNNLQVHHMFVEPSVAELLKSRTGDDVALAVGVGPESNLPANLAGCGGGVAGDNLHCYARIHALLHGCGHFLAHRVADGDDALQLEAVGGEAPLTEHRFTLGHLLIGKAQRAHGLTLVAEHAVVELSGQLAVHVGLAERQHHLGRTLHVDHFPARLSRPHDRRHVFAFGRERQFIDDVGVLAQRHVVGAVVAQPEQQGTLGGVAHHLRRGGVGEVELGRGVDSDGFGHASAGVVVAEALVVETDEIGLIHTHLVLRERSRLVGADDGAGAHRLAGVHLTHEVVGLEHPPHAVSQTQRHGHRQTLGHGDHDERDGNHQRIECVGDEVGQLAVGRERLEEVDDHRHKYDEVGHDGHGVGGPAPMVELADDEPEEHCRRHRQQQRDGGEIEIDEELAHDDQCGEHIADLRDEAAEAVELLVERRAHAVVDLRGNKHLTVLGMVADGFDLVQAVALHHLGAPEHAVGGVGRIFIEFIGVGALVGDGLTGERRLVDAEAHRLEQGAVGGYLHARVEDDEVAHDDVFLRHCRGIAVADNLDRLVVVDLIENGKLLVGLHLEIEGDARGQEDGNEDADGLEEDVGTLAKGKILIAGDANRQDAGYEQNDNQWIVELLEELHPQRILGRGCEDVYTKLSAVGLHLSGGQPMIVMLLLHDKGVNCTLRLSSSSICRWSCRQCR